MGRQYIRFYGGYLTFYGIKENKKYNIKDVLDYKKDIYCSFPHGGFIFLHQSFWDNIFKGYDEIQPYMLDDFDLGINAWISEWKCRTYNKDYVLHLGVGNSTNKR